MRRGPWIVRPADRRHSHSARGLLEQRPYRPEPADVPGFRRRFGLGRLLDERGLRRRPGRLLADTSRRPARRRARAAAQQHRRAHHGRRARADGRPGRTRWTAPTPAPHRRAPKAASACSRSTRPPTHGRRRPRAVDAQHGGRGRRAPRRTGRQRLRGARRAAGGDVARGPVRLGHRHARAAQPAAARREHGRRACSSTWRGGCCRRWPGAAPAPPPAPRPPHPGRCGPCADRTRVVDVLRVGLTGGIGSGKSTVAARLVERGAVLVDSDRLARDASRRAPRVWRRWSTRSARRARRRRQLDRPALAAVVFDDPAARATLNGIVHPLVRQRSAELIAAVPEDSIVVQDIPLLVEGGMAAQFPLVVVVHADAPVRVRRLVEQRGMPEADARARIAAQADDAARRAVADVWLDNSGQPAALVAAVDALWDRRLAPFAAGLAADGPHPDHRRRRPRPGVARAGRPARRAGRGRGRGAGPWCCARRRRQQCPVCPPRTSSTSCSGCRRPPPPTRCAGRSPRRASSPGGPGYASADPGRPARCRCRVGSPGWRGALRVRDWLRAEPQARAAVPADPTTREAAAGHGPHRRGGRRR